MGDGERTKLRALLDRLLATRARREREERETEPWQAADAELHAIERAIFRLPLDTAASRRDERRACRTPPSRATAGPNRSRQRAL